MKFNPNPLPLDPLKACLTEVIQAGELTRWSYLIQIRF